MTLAHLVNHQIRLAARPNGMPKTSDWSHTTQAVAEPLEGGVTLKTLALSLDPAMRGWMNEGKSYIPPVGIGEVMRAGGVGTVIASKNEQFTVGDYVSAGFGVQEYTTIEKDEIKRNGLVKIDLRAGSLTQWLNVLGMPGMTAYFGLMDVGMPQPGETVVRYVTKRASPAGYAQSFATSWAEVSTPYAAALLDLRPESLDPQNSVRYRDYIDPLQPLDLDDQLNYTPLKRPDPKLRVLNIGGEARIDLCNRANDTPLEAGFHELRIIVTDRPWFKADPDDVEGQAGVPDIANGATFDTTSYIFHCDDKTVDHCKMDDCVKPTEQQ